jgi:Ca2+-binding RTX toxin-like protein
LNATDVVDERANEGHDEVKAMVSGFRLPDNVETLYLLSAYAQGHGNEADNGLFGNGAANQLFGQGGDDVIVSYGGNDTITGGRGDDLLSGGVGNDTYVYNPDDGYDSISNLDAKGTDTLLIHGATESQIWLKMYDKSLAISIIGRDGEITVGNWARGASYQIDTIRLDNGKTLSANHVTNLVNAMAAFTPPPAGQTTLPPSHQAALGGLIATSWQ